MYLNVCVRVYISVPEEFKSTDSPPERKREGRPRKKEGGRCEIIAREPRHLGQRVLNTGTDNAPRDKIPDAVRGM